MLFSVSVPIPNDIAQKRERNGFVYHKVTSGIGYVFVNGKSQDTSSQDQGFFIHFFEDQEIDTIAG